MKLFPLPKEFADANLNTLTFDNRVIWFTGQSGVYGRVDPKTGKVEAWAAPRGAGTYGITNTPSGEVWYAWLASDHIAHGRHRYPCGDGRRPAAQGVGPRRIWSDSKACRGRGWRCDRSLRSDEKELTRLSDAAGRNGTY